MEKSTVKPRKTGSGMRKEKTKAVRSRRMRRQGEQTENLREKTDDLLFGERDVK